MEVIVPDEFLSIAIGKKGQNVRLASKLTGWHLDVKSETRYNQAMQTGYDSLVALPGVGIGLADALYESGFYSAEEIANANIEDLTQIRGIGEEKAVKLLEAAQVKAAEKSAEAGEDRAAEPATAENEAAAENSVAEDDLAAPAVEEDDDDDAAPAAEDGDDDDAASAAEDGDDAAETAAEDETAGPEDSPTPARPLDTPESKEN